MNKMRAMWMAVGMGMMAMLYGCPPARHAAPAPPPAPLVADAAAASIHRVQASGPLIGDFNLRALDLPGRTEADNRAIIQQCLYDLSQILPLLQGSAGSGAFAQQLRLIDSSRGQLQALPADDDSSPTINIGLRASYNALVNIDRQQFADQMEISKTLATLGARLDELDATHGPMARQVQEEAARLMGQVMQQMHQVMKHRLGTVAPKPAAQPAPPVPQPAPPASQPARPATRH